MSLKHIALAIWVALTVLFMAYALFVVQESSGHEIISSIVPHKEARVLFGGDMMFDRSIRQYAQQYGGDYLFDCIDGTLAGADLVVANLEGPITASPSVSVGSTPGGEGNFTFTFPISTAALLLKHHIGLVNLGNNHIENFDSAGVVSTIHWLSDAGVQYFGDPINHTVVQKDINGVKLSFINYNEFLPPGIGTASTTLAQIRAEKDAGRMPVVYTHWGIEYATTAPAYVIALAHQFVDAGAVAVIGSHPHVVEQSETYNNAPIYYSLGNFIFDQYFSHDVTHGLVAELTFTPSGVSNTREIPIELSRDRKVCPL
ncbi:MAG TPA: CapA family protein [Candidatus Paceibacterota bacterium]|nr:CapA family protein [Candidatus Paceibacterota bacterium]